MKKLIVLCMLAAGIVACLVAQDITGTIEGSVLDQSAAGVPSAKVTIVNTDRHQAAVSEMARNRTLRIGVDLSRGRGGDPAGR
ncbi:MAG: hypothetical protein WBL61_01420 [Bryobacteraceae bacterium]